MQRKWLLYMGFLCTYISLSIFVSMYIDGLHILKQTKVITLSIAFTMWILHISYNELND